MTTTDITSLAPWIVEMVRAQQDIDRGAVDCTVLKNMGEVVGLRVKRQRIINFNKGDNREVMVVIADLIRGLDDGSRQLQLTLEARAGKIRKLTITNEEQKKLDAGEQ
jgi:hypothetical protein